MINRLFISFSLLFCSQVMGAESNMTKARTKRQYIETDTYFKSSQLLLLNTKIKKDEKPWGVSFDLSTGTDIAKSEGDRVYNQAFGINGAYKLNDKFGIGLQTGLKYFAVDGNLPKEEGNPHWEDISISLSQELGIFKKIKLSHSVSTFAPTSYDSQYEGIKTGLSYDVSAMHEIYFLHVRHMISANYTMYSFEYSPTTGRRNSVWSNNYEIKVGLPFKIDKFATIGISENGSVRSAFDNEYFLTTSTLLYGEVKSGKLRMSLNYLIGSYDENQSIRYFYVNEWQQKISAGLSYEI